MLLSCWLCRVGALCRRVAWLGWCSLFVLSVVFTVFFFQAEDGIRDLVRSRGLGDVYKRQALVLVPTRELAKQVAHEAETLQGERGLRTAVVYGLSLIHI